MSDLISRQAAIDAVGNMLRRKFGIGGDLASITLAGLPSVQPTVDAVERKKGKWIDEPVYKQTIDGKTWDGYTYCSECREMHEYGYRSNFCPSCGAEMQKGEA